MKKRTAFRRFLCGLLCLLLLGGCGSGGTESSPVLTESGRPDPTVSGSVQEEPASDTAAVSTVFETQPETAAETVIAVVTETESQPESTAEPTTAFVSETREDGAKTVLINGTVFWVKDKRAIEPESSLPIENMRFWTSDRLLKKVFR
ncbi:MAG: hypothetical protein J5496_06145 [Lachnospiraceae bacterium]|nr:hypothetical protein [Lachnospiraceae bacterium]